VIFDAKGEIEGIRHAWTFDEMYSAFETEGGQGKDGQLMTKEELTPFACCSHRAARRINCQGSNRRWMKVQWQVSGRLSDGRGNGDFRPDGAPRALRSLRTLPVPE
jgi:hypothetical protein